MGRPRILLCFGLICAVSVLVPRVSYTSVRSTYLYHSKGIELTLPSKWSYEDGPWSDAGKANGTLVMRAGDAAAPVPTGVQVLRTNPLGATDTYDFYLKHRQRWHIVPKGLNGGRPREGDWNLDQATAHYIEWRSETEARCDAYILAPDGRGWHLEFYAPPTEMAALRPIVERITKSTRFDVE